MYSVGILFVLISPWLVWNSCLFYLIVMKDKSFNIVILSKTQLYKYLTYLLLLLAVSMYIFLIRFNNRGKVLNLKPIWEKTVIILKALTWGECLGLGLFGLLLITFWILFSRVILHYLKQTILALYLYYFQYKPFREICYWCVDISSEYTFYLITRVSIFTKNVNIQGNSMMIWPWGINMVLRNMYIFILPYVIIFDIIINNGEMSKFFIILPWVYIYTLFKGFWYIFDKLFKSENHELTEEVYGIR